MAKKGTNPKETLGIVPTSVYPEFAEQVAEQLDVEPIQVTRRKHPNGEIYAHYDESVRRKDLFIVAAHADAYSEREAVHYTVNDQIMQQWLLGSAARLASARRRVAVCLYAGYSRQERKNKSGEPIAAADITGSYEAFGYDRILSMDLHEGAIQGFAKIPYDHLTAGPILRKWLNANWVSQHGTKNVVLVAPDAGRTKVVADTAEKMGISYATIDKRKGKGGTVATEVIGDVDGYEATLYDDMIDGAGTMKSAAELLLEKGAKSVGAVATHGVFSANGQVKAPLNQVTVTRDGVTKVIAGGRNGATLTDPATLSVQATQFAKTIMDGKGLKFSTPLVVQPFQSVTPANFSKMIEVDVVTKQLYAYQNGEMVRSFPVSAGAPETPTPIGQFKIYSKLAQQDMRGFNADGTKYFQPKVKYVSYFLSGGYAIHGNYWRPMSWFGSINSSHGCVSLPDSNGSSKWIYDFAPIGTTFITHT